MAIGRSRMKTLGWMIGCGLVGAGAALLYAPQSGKRTRRDLRCFGTKVVNRSAAIGMDVRHSVDNLIDDAAEKLREGAQRSFEMAANAGRDVSHVVKAGQSFVRDGIGMLKHAS